MLSDQINYATTQPDYPGKFDGPTHARTWCGEYYDWYNFHHHHSGLNGYTPEQVFTGRYLDVASVKQAALDESYRLHPMRYSHGAPTAKLPPHQVSINPISSEDIANGIPDKVNFPTITAAGYQRIVC